MPLVKGYEDDDGYYHIQFAISSAEPDLQNDQMTDNALNDIVTQAKGIGMNGEQLDGINIDDDHQPGLKSIIGPVEDAWIDDEKKVYVDLKVRKQWEETIKDLVDSGVKLGGSITGKATKLLPGLNKSIRKIDGVKLFKAALTDTPAAWDTRGTAQPLEKKCPGSMCTQIMKSLGITKGVEKVPKTEKDSYEDISQRVEVAINDKYTSPDRYSSYWVKLTFQDSVIAEDWDENKTYEIPYSIGVNGEVTLGEPIEVEEQYVAKKMEVLGLDKSSLRKKRGDNVTDTENTPEGIDQTFIDKVKGLGDDGKQFIKGLLGIEEPTDHIDEPVNPDPGGNNMKKDFTLEDVKKTVATATEEATGPLIKRIETLETEINQNKTKSLEKTKKEVLKKSLEMHKKIDKNMTPEEEAELVDEIKADLEKNNGIDLVQRDIKSMSLVLEKTASGDKPDMVDPQGEGKTLSKDAEKAAELRKNIEKRGRGE